MSGAPAEARRTPSRAPSGALYLIESSLIESCCAAAAQARHAGAVLLLSVLQSSMSLPQEHLSETQSKAASECSPQQLECSALSARPSLCCAKTSLLR